MLTDLFLPGTLACAALVGATFGWLRGSSEMRCPPIYWNRMEPTEEWLTVVERTGRRERWLMAARYAVLAPVLLFLMLTLAIA